MSTSQRIQWIDTSKGIGIILVIIGHTMIDNSLRGQIYAFHMPLFFFISGYLFSNKKYSRFNEYSVAKAKSLLIPYVSFSIIAIILLRVLLHSSINFSEYIKTLVLSRRNNIYFDEPLWFLISLFTMEILYFLLAKYLKKDYLILAVLLFLSYFSVSRLGTLQGFHILPWSFDQTLYYIVYFGLGHLVKNRGWISNNLKKSYTLIIFSIIYITLLVKPNLYNMTVEIMNGPLKFPPSLTGFLLTVLWAIVAISFVIYISQFLSRLFILNFLGKNSLTLLALHVCLGFNLFNIVVIENLGLKINNPNLLGVTFTLATIAFLIPVCMLINNYFPYILGRKLNFKKTIKGTHLL